MQMVVFAVLATGLLWCAVPTFPPTLRQVLRIIDDLGWESSFLFTGATLLAALLMVVPLVRLRVGPSLRREFGFRRLTAAEVLLITAGVAPLGVLSDQVYRWGLGLNTWLAHAVPELTALTSMDAIQIVQRQAESTAYPILLVAIALAPAIGEELVFRGLIGRGLTSRWGVPAGIALTTLLFALAHGTPAHALGTVPVGLCLHLLYRATGTLWAPILLHTLNNAVAVTLMKLHSPVSLAGDSAVLFATLGYLVVIGTLLQQTKQHRAHNREFAATVGHAFPMLAASSIVAFTCVFVWSRVSGL